MRDHLYKHAVVNNFKLDIQTILCTLPSEKKNVHTASELTFSTKSLLLCGESNYLVGFL